jgi:hypothetical protein
MAMINTFQLAARKHLIQIKCHQMSLSYSTPRFFEEFQQKFPDFQVTRLDYFVFPYLKNNVFKNRLCTMTELMQVITNNCNLIDVPTLRRLFENMKQRK